MTPPGYTSQQWYDHKVRYYGEGYMLRIGEKILTRMRTGEKIHNNLDLFNLWKYVGDKIQRDEEDGEEEKRDKKLQDKADAAKKVAEAEAEEAEAKAEDEKKHAQQRTRMSDFALFHRIGLITVMRPELAARITTTILNWADSRIIAYTKDETTLRVAVDWVMIELENLPNDDQAGLEPEVAEQMRQFRAQQHAERARNQMGPRVQNDGDHFNADSQNHVQQERSLESIDLLPLPPQFSNLPGFYQRHAQVDKIDDEFTLDQFVLPSNPSGGPTIDSPPRSPGIEQDAFQLVSRRQRRPYARAAAVDETPVPTPAITSALPIQSAASRVYNVQMRGAKHSSHLVGP